MTCIVGIETNCGVIFGCDSYCGGSNQVDSVLTKIIKVGTDKDIMLGITTDSSSLINTLYHRLEIPPRKKETPEKYVHTTLIDSIRKTVKELGYTTDDCGSLKFRGAFLLAYDAKMYVIYNDLHISMFQRKYQAIGSGEEYALGALAACDNLDPDARVLKALQCSAKLSSCVEGPFIIERQIKK